jgi:hypothetical protein
VRFLGVSPVGLVAATAGIAYFINLAEHKQREMATHKREREAREDAAEQRRAQGATPFPPLRR